MGYALVKIRVGARIAHDHCFFGKWPECCPPMKEHGGEFSFHTKFPDAVFVGEKITTETGAEWKCKRHGYGMGPDWGNGSIVVRDAALVEMLTPLLAYEPQLPDSQNT